MASGVEKWTEHRGAQNKQAEHGRVLTSNTISYKSGYSKLCTNAVIYFDVFSMYCVVSRWCTDEDDAEDIGEGFNVSHQTNLSAEEPCCRLPHVGKKCT